MEQRTRTQFRKPVEYEEKDDFPDACYDFKDPQGSGALAVFMRGLRAFIKEQECKDGHCTKKYEITLIGHSMGAMVLDELVRTNPDMDFTNIVFMGAAVSARRVVENIVPYLERNPGTRFYNLSLHPENEDREASAAGLTPSGSLPVWIDTMYTTPESDLDKTAGRWKNMRVVRHVFPKETYESQMRFKVFGLDKNRHPQAHGDFDNFPFWQREFWWKPDRAYRCESGD
jgi:pimeloyl-ACP methyl ester carboxylesterase